MRLTRGSLYRYNYLWSREDERKEISGRKARPICLVVRSSTTPAALFLFPITTKAPSGGTLAIEIPASQCRRGNLAHPSWIVVDEYNRVSEEDLYDFESLVPLGEFSHAFLKLIGLAIQKCAEEKRLRAVVRT